MWGSKDNLQESVPLFHYAGLWNWTLVARLGGNYFTHWAILRFLYMKLLYNISDIFVIVIFYFLLFIVIDLTKCSFLPNVNSDYFWVVSFGLFPPLYKFFLVEFFSSQQQYKALSLKSKWSLIFWVLFCIWGHCLQALRSALLKCSSHNSHDIWGLESTWNR